MNLKVGHSIWFMTFHGLIFRVCTNIFFSELFIQKKKMSTLTPETLPNSVHCEADPGSDPEPYRYINGSGSMLENDSVSVSHSAPWITATAAEYECGRYGSRSVRSARTGC